MIDGEVETEGNESNADTRGRSKDVGAVCVEVITEELCEEAIFSFVYLRMAVNLLAGSSPSLLGVLCR
jgi:hypothetical protein